MHVKAKYDFLLFAHQDVSFDSKNFLEQAYDFVIRLRNPGIIGIAGAKFNKKRNRLQFLNQIEHGIPPILWGRTDC